MTDLTGESEMEVAAAMDVVPAESVAAADVVVIEPESRPRPGKLRECEICFDYKSDFMVLTCAHHICTNCFQEV